MAGGVCFVVKFWHDNLNVDVAYSSNFIKVIWEHENCDGYSLLNGADIIGTSLDWLAKSLGYYFRVNNSYIGDQRTPSVGGSPFNMSALAWQNLRNNQFLYKEVGSGSVAAISDNSFNSELDTYPNPARGILYFSGWSS